MVNLIVLFWYFVLLFGLIGAMRGWAREMLVTFSIILGIFLITVLETYVSLVKNTIYVQGGAPLFWMRTIILSILVFFGYQTVNIRAINPAKLASDRLQDWLLGFMIGALNGYLFVGSIWYYMDQAGYPFSWIQAPQPGMPGFDTAMTMLSWMPPAWLVIPLVYFAVGIAFLFVIVVFI
jgi:hypothetical protein